MTLYQTTLLVSALAVLQVGAESAPASPPDNVETGTVESISPADSREAEEVPTEKRASPDSKPKADIAEMGLEELMAVQVVVTASRRAQAIESVPHAVTVITANDIRAAGARSIPDALRLAAGVDVADLSYGNAAVAPRGFHGFDSRQVLVLVDGRQIFDSLFGGTLWGSWPFQLEDVERIEVIRGPAGVIWGANAVNGVINIITKNPADQQGVTMTLGGGSRGTYKEHIGYGFQEGNLKLRLSAENEGSDGFRTGHAIFSNSSDDYIAGRMGIHALYDWGPTDKLTLSAGSGVVGGGTPRTPLAGIGSSRYPGSQASFILAKWLHHVTADDSYEVTAFINDFWGSPGLRQFDYRYQQLAFQFARVFTPKPNHTLMWGIDTRADLLDATNSDPQLLSKKFVGSETLGLYAQDEWRFAPRWTLDLGASVHYDFYGGFQPSAEAALIHDLTEHTQVFGSVSRAFQMPPAGLRFLDLPILNGLAWAVGKRGVDPETLIAYQIGARWKPCERLHTSAALYWHDYDELTTLSPRIGPPGLLALDLDNRGEAAAYGFELESRYTASSKLTLLANYTYQNLAWRASVPFHDKDLISPPQHKATIGARYDLAADLHLSSYLYFVDATHAPNAYFPFLAKGIDPYLRLDLRVEHEFWNDRASIAFGVRNLLDPEHLEGGTLFLNQAEAPRMVYVECRIHIP
jgi:iron complex outermembrane receptor protein